MDNGLWFPLSLASRNSQSDNTVVSRAWNCSVCSFSISEFLFCPLLFCPQAPALKSDLLSLFLRDSAFQRDPLLLWLRVPAFQGALLKVWLLVPVFQSAILLVWLHGSQTETQAPLKVVNRGQKLYLIAGSVPESHRGFNIAVWLIKWYAPISR